MGKFILPKNHISVIKADDVAQICKPLFDEYDINIFIYARIFDDGSAYPLVSHREYHIHHMQKKYLVSPPIPKEGLPQKFVYLFSEDRYSPFQSALDDLYKFNARYPFYMFERYDGFYDFYLFCSKPDNPQIINFYLNHMDILEKFKFYFKEKADSLIKVSQKSKLILLPEMRPTFGGLEKCETLEETLLKKNRFLKKISPSHYLIEQAHRKISLTPREMDTIKHLIGGQTLKEMGKTMHVSPRTVEVYVNKLKEKLKVHRKSDIIKVLIKLGFSI